jgi:5-methylcytosine-specific restriction enzyme A
MSSTLVEAVKVVALQLSIADRQVLQALLFAPHQAASAGQLKTILGLSAVVQVNAAMGRVGRKLYETLGAHPDGLPSDEFEWWHVVASGEATKDRGFVWKLREQVVSGLLSCGYSASGDMLADEVINSDKLTEGAVRQITVNAYERNPVARTRCIEAHGVGCYVCGFNFGAAYGASASGFIHVHHIKPLATIAEQYEVNPVEDLRPVCPNCHAVIHMTNPPRSIEEVRALLFASETPNPSFQRTAFDSR